MVIHEGPAGRGTNSRRINSERMTLTSFKPFIDLILNQETVSKSDSDNGSSGEHSASIRVNSLFPKLLKLSSAASTAPLEVLSKDDPEHGQLPQKTNVLLKLYKTSERVKKRMSVCDIF